MDIDSHTNLVEHFLDKDFDYFFSIGELCKRNYYCEKFTKNGKCYDIHHIGPGNMHISKEKNPLVITVRYCNTIIEHITISYNGAEVGFNARYVTKQPLREVLATASLSPTEK